MTIEVLYIAGCPNGQRVVDAVRAAVAEPGRADVRVSLRLIDSPEGAAAVPFAGSPTVLIDGRDAVPGAPRTTELACRVYPSADGTRGHPSVRQLIAALSGTPVARTGPAARCPPGAAGRERTTPHGRRHA